ncbi:HNH endonuclease [Microbacterium caowuchunii]|uniref:HNH endonuclease n=1 Tax=Microbacterium caowuchunii TaxID=2614638 RepID=A0A5N0TFA8_9MICO|nr:HNH endonuclease [Microbacterium caowuchunii]KAA9133742.1 HNH endonuclease [Microbacterium caowuchunii]
MLNSAAYQKLSRELKAEWRAINAPCWLCGQAIDYDAPFNDPNSCEPDHVKPRKTHPHLALDRNNIRPSHCRCNRSRGAGAPAPGLGEPSEEW